MSDREPFERFLPDHRPAAPSAPPEELRILAARLRGTHRPGRSPGARAWARRLGVGAALAAAVVTVTSVALRRTSRRPQVNVEVAAFVADIYGALDEDADEPLALPGLSF